MVPCSTSLAEPFHGSMAGSRERQRRLTIKYCDLDRATIDPPVGWTGGVVSRATWDTIDTAASSAGLILRHVATVSQFTTMMSFVRAGIGIAIVPSGVIAGLLGKGLTVLNLIKPRLSRNVGLIWLRARELTPAAQGFAVIFEETWRATVKN